MLPRLSSFRVLASLASPVRVQSPRAMPVAKRGPVEPRRPALFVFRRVPPLEHRSQAAVRQAGQMASGELSLAPVTALYAYPVRERWPCRRAAVLDLGWPSRAPVVLFVCPQASLPREPLGLRRFVRTVAESSLSSLISPYPACHAPFQADYLGCLATHHHPVIPMVYQFRRVCRGVYLFQLA
jgi:hypothetical protein